MLEVAGRLDDAVAERERHPALEGAAAFRTALNQSELAYRGLVQQGVSREIEMLTARVMTPDPSRVDDIFAPPVIRLVQLFARMNDWKRVRSWRLQAQAERPGLSRWFDAIPEIQDAGNGAGSSRVVDGL